MTTMRRIRRYLVLVLGPAMALGVPVYPVSAGPLRMVGGQLPDRTLVAAIAGATLNDAVDLVLGAASLRQDRPELVSGILNETPAFSDFERSLLLTRYLEHAYVIPFTAEQRDPPLETLDVVERALQGMKDTGLRATFFRLSVLYQRPPERKLLIESGLDVAERLRAGVSGPTTRRLTFALLDAMALSPHPALGGVADEIRRSAPDREIVQHAAEIARGMFD